MLRLMLVRIRSFLNIVAVTYLTILEGRAVGIVTILRATPHILPQRQIYLPYELLAKVGILYIHTCM
mgnify:CR=1 FL=1